MVALAAYYARGHGDDPVLVATADEVDQLIDRVRAESPERAPILIEVHIAGDPYAQGLDVGNNGKRGVLRYSGREWPDGVYSFGGDSADPAPLQYFYMDTDTEFPATAEVPLAIVRQAVLDFLATGGALPSGVTWRRAA
ncbi:MAG TPA: Imm1 family immunity protein [Pseudonocardiaceae bacterium]|nr:Imm1 family immunity protein [Pseudonocardiaceae bacterium]